MKALKSIVTIKCNLGILPRSLDTAAFSSHFQKFLCESLTTCPPLWHFTRVINIPGRGNKFKEYPEALELKLWPSCKMWSHAKGKDVG